MQLDAERAKRVGSVELADDEDGVDVGNYTTVLIWCEAFGEFIAAARYR